jgi:hypothetical protein
MTTEQKENYLSQESLVKSTETSLGIYSRQLSARQERSVAELAERLYDYMPPVCWMTEEHLAEALGTTRWQIRNAKAYLLKQERVKMEFRPNGKRKNMVQTIVKSAPINQYIRDEGLRWEINWRLFHKTAAKDVNQLQIAELLEFYEEIGLQFIPLHYPKFKRNLVYCSCRRGRNCHAIGKHPALAYKSLDFTDKRTFKAMRNWWLNVDINYNVGFKVDGYVVLDVDFKKGGQISLGILQEDYGELPIKLSVKTGNGRHIYVQPFDAHNDVEVMGLSGLDVRASGGIVVAPNSVHQSKNEYQWETVGEPAQLPESWLTFFQGERNSPAQTTKQRRAGAQPEVLLPTTLDSNFVIPEGKRNRTLFGFACRERGRGAKYDYILDVLSTLNETYCEPKLAHTELKDIATSAMRYQSEADKRQHV